jgi:hypothetical protein
MTKPGWMKRVRIKTKNVLGAAEKARLEKLESALELEVVGKRRANVDKTSADTISSLINAIKDTEEAVLRVGSIIVIKHNGRVWAEKVNELVARELEENPTIIKRPKQLALFFEEGRQHARALDPIDEPQGEISKQGNH